MDFTPNRLEEALQALGLLLESRKQRAEIAVIGGGSLLLLGLIQRPTKDLDVVALVEGVRLRTAKPLPDDLVGAVRDVGRAMGLAEDWLNPGPTELLDRGLPAGFMQRVMTRSFGSLVVHVAHRSDQIFFKLYAAVDQGPHSKHFADLKQLAPSSEELRAAARWCVSHDPSEGFAEMLKQALAALGVEHDG